MPNNSSQTGKSDFFHEGIIAARPTKPSREPLSAGRHPLRLADGREALLYVPIGYRAGAPAPLAVMLHGAGGNAGHGLSLLLDLADDAGILLFAPRSRQATWDVIADEYGPDVRFITEALEYVFDRLEVDPARIAVGGFSDGASYALSLGLINGGLFTHIIAFSPGFMAPTRREGRPRIYVSHGTEDRVLPIDRCSRRIVPQLEMAGYSVIYREFDGPHWIPPEISSEAAVWLRGESI